MKRLFKPLLWISLALLLGGCLRAKITPTPTPLVTGCNGPYTWAYGSVSQDFIDQVQSALHAQGLSGSVSAGTFGENNGDCGYGAMAVDYVFTIAVDDLQTSINLVEIADKVLDLAQRFVDFSPAPNLGLITLVFQSEGWHCSWSFTDRAWNANAPGDENGILCPVPASPGSQMLEDALRLLSQALSCGNSSITTNDIQSILECERPVEKNLYTVTVTMRLNDGVDYSNACFHGYEAYLSSVTGETPMSVTDATGTYFERQRSFSWAVPEFSINLFERVSGDENVAYPADIHEEIFQALLQTGLFQEQGFNCQ